MHGSLIPFILRALSFHIVTLYSHIAHPPKYLNTLLKYTDWEPDSVGSLYTFTEHELDRHTNIAGTIQSSAFMINFRAYTHQFSYSVLQHTYSRPSDTYLSYTQRLSAFYIQPFIDLYNSTDSIQQSNQTVKNQNTQKEHGKY